MYFSISPSAPSTSYSTASPMDIPTSSSRSGSCAFPSWPQRSSLSSSASSSTSSSSSSDEYHNHSFVISDEELFGGVYEESAASTPASDMSRSPIGSFHDRARESDGMALYLAHSGSLMREMVRQEKERRQSQQRLRSASTGSRRRKSKKMTVIAEVAE